MQLKSLNLLLPLGIILLFLTQNSFAQVPGMAQVRTNMNNQFMRQQMNMSMQQVMNMPMRKRAGNSSKMYNGGNEYTYLVQMKDGSEKKVKSYIYIDTIKNKDYLLVVDKNFPRSDSAHRFVRIYNDQTISIKRDMTPYDPQNDSPKPVYYTGMATDSCWLFHAIDGRISLYSYFSEDGNNSYLFDPSTIVAMQIQNGPVQKFSIEDLKAQISGDEKAMKYFNKQNYLEAVKRYNKDMEKPTEE
jgi:hypothetical protein